jgi:hypothetical protein
VPSTPNQLNLLMIGTNDSTLYANPSYGNSTPAYLSDFAAIHLASSAAYAVPDASKVKASAMNCTGTWTAGSYYSGLEMMSSTTGSSCTFTAAGTAIYLGYTAVTGNTGAASVSIDGAAQAPITFAPQSTLETYNQPSNVYDPFMVRYGGLSNTPHTVIVTVTSGSGTVYLDWAVGLSGSVKSNWPVVLLNSPPNQYPSDSVTPIFASIISTNAGILSGDGLRTYYVNQQGTLSNSALDYEGWGSTPCSSGAECIHPTDGGNEKLANANIAVLNSSLGLNLPPIPVLPYAAPTAIFNNAVQGAYNLGIGFTTLAGNSSGTSTPNSSPNTGYNNVAIGDASMSGIVSGHGNSSFGVLNQNAANYSGSNNTSGGASDLQNVTSGSENTGLGFVSLALLTTGMYNTCIGGDACEAEVSNNGVTAVGTFALENIAANYATAMGYGAGQNVTSGTSIALFGVDAGSALTTGIGDSVFGAFALQSSAAAASYESAFGYQALKNVTANSDSAFGYDAFPALTSGGNTVGMGVNCGLLITTGGYNTCVGANAMSNTATGINYDLAVGDNVLVNDTAGWNEGIGHYALNADTSGTGNTAMGIQALTANLTGNSNTCVGSACLAAVASANLDTAVGYGACQTITTGNYNVCLGGNAGVNGTILLTNASSVFIGDGANASANGLTNDICIGTLAQCTASNQTSIGASNTTNTQLFGITSHPSQTAIASATTIAPTNQFFHVTGTTAIATITAPAACTVSGFMCQLTIIPDGLWTTTTSGNIAIASTAVVGKAEIMTYDPAASKWYPSY